MWKLRRCVVSDHYRTGARFEFGPAYCRLTQVREAAEVEVRHQKTPGPGQGGHEQRVRRAMHGRVDQLIREHQFLLRLGDRWLTASCALCYAPCSVARWSRAQGTFTAERKRLAPVTQVVDLAGIFDTRPEEAPAFTLRIEIETR